MTVRKSKNPFFMQVLTKDSTQSNINAWRKYLTAASRQLFSKKALSDLFDYFLNTPLYLLKVSKYEVFSGPNAF